MIVAETGVAPAALLADPDVLDELVAIRVEQVRDREQQDTERRLRARLNSFGG